MKASPKVSVVIPNYNHCKYLPQRIESVLNQTISDIEIIILDDCSTDNSRQIIQQYAAQDTRIYYLFNEVNSGSVFKQWMKGVERALGEYIWIAESDDYASPFFLEKLLPVLANNTSVGLVYSNSIIVDDNGKEYDPTSLWKNKRYNTNRWNTDFVNSGKEELESFLSDNCTINNGSSVLFRKSVLSSKNLIDQSLRFAGDWMVYIKIAAQFDIAYLSECLNYYRSHSSNASKKSEINGDIYIERACCLSEAYKGMDDSDSKQKALNGAAVAYVDVLYNCLRLNPSISRLVNFVSRLAMRDFFFFLKVQEKAFKIILSKV